MTWTIHLRVEGKNSTLHNLPRDITIEDLLHRIAATSSISPKSLRVFCGGVLIKSSADVENAVAVETFSVLRDGVTAQVLGDPEVPVATRGLWREVTMGLEQGHTIVRKKYADSLAAAKEHFADEEARHFVHANLCKIVAETTSKDGERIGRTEREHVLSTLNHAAELVSMDLQTGTRGRILKALGYLLDPTVKFLAKPAKATKSISIRTSFSGGGAQQATVRRIGEHFSKLDGFINLATYMAENIWTHRFPNPRVVAHVVHFLSSETSSESEPKLESLQDKSAATVIVKCSIDHISSCNEDYLQEMSENAQLLKILREALLQAVRSERIATDCDEPQLWDLWSSVILRMIGAEQSFAVRKSGWAAWHDLVEWSTEAILSNETLIVKGAGTDFVNGTYTPTKVNWAENRVYVRIVPDGFGEASGKTLTCFRCVMRSLNKWWFISEADEKQPGTDRDVDYYQSKNSGDAHDRPQLSGWGLCTLQAHGLAPAPVLELTGTLGVPKEQAIKMPPYKFCRWVQENSLLSKADSDYAYSELFRPNLFETTIETEEAACNLLLLLRYGISEEARSLGLPVVTQIEEVYNEMIKRKTQTPETLRVVKESNPEGDYFKEHVATLKQMIDNTLIDRDEKYSKLEVSNALGLCTVSSLKGVDPLMKALGFDRNRGSDGIEVYSYGGSVFGLLAVKGALDDTDRHVMYRVRARGVAT
eukprot:CAMPEP_0197458884 /NCGR_PEP_ID=MMETSP1175-20131217/49901_1 /TAXON_ID=1003142 /ORGANISM="Triceratium dubium, Strain CCMP147" /LENGTH=705 /DNA_ID=CAMNT_0042993619 /DNA_START=99 /DNA_END=2216 /DNA_ORIENTATION=-